MEENKRPVEKNPELSVQIITRQTAPRKTALEIELQIHSQFTASCSDCICNPPRVRDWACLQPRAGGTACLTLAVSLGSLGRHQSLPDGVKGKGCCGGAGDRTSSGEGEKVRGRMAWGEGITVRLVGVLGVGGVPWVKR